MQGGFGSVFALSETLTRAIPLMLTGLAATVAFKARLFNIGAEGQLYVGALAAVAVGGLHGGAGLALPPYGGIIADLRRMDKIVEIDGENMFVTIEPGINSGFDLQDSSAGKSSTRKHFEVAPSVFRKRLSAPVLPAMATRGAGFL